MIDKNRLPKTMLAPLAGYTDAGFRRLAKKFGCGLTVTEMVSAKALTLGNTNTFSLLFCDEDGAKSVQLFGHDPTVFAEACRHPLIEDFDVIDVNMGCPQRKIVGNGEGCALMRTPKLAAEIIKSIRRNTDKLVSVKFRKGFGDDDVAVEFAKVCEGAGADFLTVHGRTSNKQFAGTADWDVIARVVAAVRIPVFANGDIVDKDSYDKVLADTGCYGAAIGRGAIGRPYVFKEIAGESYSFDVVECLKEHVSVLNKIYPSHVVANEIKKHVAYYVKGRRGAKQLVTAVMASRDAEEIVGFVREFFKQKIDD